jgi:anthranilate 1,2-dioxygenase small subunit
MIQPEAGGARAVTNFVVVRIMQNGKTMLFARRCYRERVAFDGPGGRALIAERTVILDSRQIDTLLAIPI